MLRKLSFSIILIIILSIFYSNSLIKLVTVYNLSKWSKKEVNINSVKLNYFKKEIVIKNLLIKNKEDGLYFKNLFIVEKIIINLKFSSVFNNPVMIDSVLFKNPKYYLELFDDPENDIIKKNNIALSDNTISNDKPIIYKKKKIDVNFLISKI